MSINFSLLSVLSFTNNVNQVGFFPSKNDNTKKTFQVPEYHQNKSNNLNNNANQQEFLDWYDEYAYSG